MNQFSNFFKKNVDLKRLVTYLIVYLIIWIVSLIWNHLDFIKLKNSLGSIFTYSISVPLLPTLLILIIAQYYIQKVLLKFQVKFGKKKSISLDNWTVTTDKSTPQWTANKEIPLNNGLLSSAKCTLVVKSNYLRFGFKLLDKNAHTFGTNGILTNENNGLFHIGNGSGDNRLLTTCYKNGVQDGTDIFSGNFSIDEIIKLELKIDDNNNFELFINGHKYYQTVIRTEYRERLVLMAWGDGHDYEMSISEIEVTIKE